MLHFKYLISAWILALTVSVANANTITTFDVSGTFFYSEGGPVGPPPIPPSGPPGAFAGTFSIDVNTGIVTGFDIKFPGLPDFTNVPVPPYGFIGPGTGSSGIFVATGSYLFYLEFLNDFAAHTQSVFTGAPITYGEIDSCPSPDCAFGIQPFIVDISGSITAATPLPAALPLFATGLGALGLLGWRRKRKAQAAA